MLIVALILAVVGLAALVTAVVTSNELVAWVCIGASGLGVLLLIVDAIRDKSRRGVDELPGVVGATTRVIPPGETTEVIPPGETTEVIPPVETTEAIPPVETVPDETHAAAEDSDVWKVAESALDDEDLAGDEDDSEAVEEHPEELVHDDPDYDTLSDDEPDYPEPAEEAAVHIVSEEYLAAEEENDAGDAVEVHYASGVEDSAATVVYTYAEDTEVRYVEAGNPQVEGRQQHDQ